jgi:hypothetical protein
MAIKVFQVRGYPASHYFVETFSELLEIMRWAKKNGVGVLHESSSVHGHGFSVRKNFEWFALKWL